MNPINTTTGYPSLSGNTIAPSSGVNGAVGGAHANSSDPHWFSANDMDASQTISVSSSLDQGLSIDQLSQNILAHLA